MILTRRVKILAGLAALGAAFAAGWTAQGWRADARVQACQAEVATERAAAAETALDQLQLAASAVATAAADVVAAGQRAAQATDAARRRWKTEVAAQPLPPDCRRDSGRVQALRGAIERAGVAP